MGPSRPLWLLAVPCVTTAIGCGRVGFSDVSGLTDATTGATDDAPGDGAAPGICNSVARFADDFEDNGDLDDLWRASYASPGTGFAETGGAAVLTLAPNVAGAYAGYKTSRYYNLTGQRAWTEIIQFPDPAAEVGIAVDFNSATYVHLGIQNGMVRATQQVAGVYTVLGTVPYSTTNRFVGIREDAGQLVFETSADGVLWVPFQTSPAPFDISLIEVTLFAGTSSAVASPGLARFASLNGGVPLALPACPVSSLIDHFDDGVIDRRWARAFSQLCCGYSESGGEMQLTSDGTAGFTGIRSAGAYSLTESAFTFKLASDPNPASTVYAYAGLVDGPNKLQLRVTNTMIESWMDINSVPSNNTHTRMAGEVYFRIHHTGGQVTFEASPDGAAWRVLRSLPTPFALDAMEVGLELGDNSSSTASQVRYDDVGGP